jgi:transcriptional regulator GlxA family with amidase domain
VKAGQLRMLAVGAKERAELFPDVPTVAETLPGFAAYAYSNHLAQADPLIQRFEKRSRDHLKTGFSLQAGASALATSTRSLQRPCQDVLGKSPVAYFQDLRVDRAQWLLHRSSLDLEAIAGEVGYADGAALRTLLRERLGRGVRELRADLR